MVKFHIIWCDYNTLLCMLPYMKLTETRMWRGPIWTLKIGVPWKQTVTLTFSDKKEDTTGRFSQMQQQLKNTLVGRIRVTSQMASVIDGLKICPTANSVCLFGVNAKTTARIDANCPGITKNDTESVLCGLKSPVLVISGRYSDISAFTSWSTATKTALTMRHIATDNLSLREPSHPEQKYYCYVILHYVLCTKKVVYPEALH